MKRLTAIAAAIASLVASAASPAFAHRTWILLVEDQKAPYNLRTYIDMQSVVVKDSVAYFNTGSGKDFLMPRDGLIHSAVMHCGRRTVGIGGSYVPSPLDFEQGLYAGFRSPSQTRINWSNRFNKQLEMVCPTEVLSKDLDEAQAWDDKQN